jgi:hypothetical protein
MRHASPLLQQYVSAKRFRGVGDAIEWEELPSLADTLAERLVSEPARRRGVSHYEGLTVTAWDNTMPAELLAIVPTQPFRETLRGLETREVHEPDVFRHFFGSQAA